MLLHFRITTNFSTNCIKIFFLRKKIRVRFSLKLKNKIECFNVKKVNKIFFYCDDDYKIDFILETKFSNKKIYDLTKNQIVVIKAYTNKMFNKNFIRKNFSNFSIFVLIVKKFKKDLRICVNYRAFNVFTFKNRNCFSIIKEIFARLYAAKFYTKFDVITIFNEIRIRENDEHKIAFLIRYDLYEYIVMFFDFCNAFETFQLYINDILRQFLNDFCFVYLNDVLIYNKNKKKHTIHVRKILDKLLTANFYLNIDKCEFYVNEIKYFDLIITIDDIKINLKKIKIIFE